MARFLRWLGLILLLVVAALFTLGPRILDGAVNKSLVPGPPGVSEAAKALHGRLLVADLHADTLLWNRDVLARNDYGHVDVPRLAEGGVAIQAFTIVTKTPPSYSLDGNTADYDAITPLVFFQRWPRASWRSLAARTLYQAEKLEEAAKASAGTLTLLRTQRDLASFLERRAKDPRLVAAFLGIEGAHALDDDARNLDAFFAAGVRMIAPSHFFDNGIGGSAHGALKFGLTELGAAVLRRAEAMGMLLDLAHASPAVIDDVLAFATKPVVVSHTGVTGTCPNLRNITDGTVRKIAKNGGVIGIGYWEMAVCALGPEAIAKAILHVRNLVGAEHVALGSDFDGTITAPFDTTGVPRITEALMAAGLSEAEIGLVMGGNVIKLLSGALPP